MLEVEVNEAIVDMRMPLLMELSRDNIRLLVVVMDESRKFCDILMSLPLATVVHKELSLISYVFVVVVIDESLRDVSLRVKEVRPALSLV